MRKLLYTSVAALALLTTGCASNFLAREKLDAEKTFFKIPYHMSQASKMEMERVEGILAESATLDSKAVPEPKDSVVLYDWADSLDESRDRKVYSGSVEEVVRNVENTFLDIRKAGYQGLIKELMQQRPTQ